MEKVVGQSEFMIYLEYTVYNFVCAREIGGASLILGLHYHYHIIIIKRSIPPAGLGA